MIHRFERGRDIRRTLSIGSLKSLKDDYLICVIDEDDFKEGKIHDNIWEDDSDIQIDDLRNEEEVVERFKDSWVAIFHFKGQFKIVESKFNENGYPEDWQPNQLYPERLLPACLNFWMKKMKEIQDIPIRAAERFLKNQSDEV